MDPLGPGLLFGLLGVWLKLEGLLPCISTLANHQIVIFKLENVRILPLA